jgi:hypothetical protein
MMSRAMRAAGGALCEAMAGGLAAISRSRSVRLTIPTNLSIHVDHREAPYAVAQHQMEGGAKRGIGRNRPGMGRHHIARRLCRTSEPRHLGGQFGCI